MAKDSSSKAVAQPVVTRLRMKGQRKELHHLFKSDVQPMKKNVSYKKGQPKIDTVEHTHHFHSINSQLKPQQYSTTVGGHFHEIEWGIVDGQPVVKKVGPPIHYKYVSKPSGQKRVKTPVRWVDGNADSDDGAPVYIADTHAHTFRYVHSEELSEANVRAAAPDLADDMKAAGIQEGTSA